MSFLILLVVAYAQGNSYLDMNYMPEIHTLGINTDMAISLMDGEDLSDTFVFKEAVFYQFPHMIMGRIGYIRDNRAQTNSLSLGIGGHFVGYRPRASYVFRNSTNTYSFGLAIYRRLIALDMDVIIGHTQGTQVTVPLNVAAQFYNNGSLSINGLSNFTYIINSETPQGRLRKFTFQIGLGSRIKLAPKTHLAPSIMIPFVTNTALENSPTNVVYFPDKQLTIGMILNIEV